MGSLCSKRAPKKTAQRERLPPPPPSTQNAGRFGTTSYPFVVAVHDFTPTGPNQVEFMKGDVLEIFNSSGDDWWRGRHQVTKEEGYIPVAYTAPVTSLESREWYFGTISRDECEALLMSPSNPVGAFMVRDSYRDSNNHKYSLSVKIKGRHDTKLVTHYRIFVNTSGYYFIYPCAVYATLIDLIEAQIYRSERDVIREHLTMPCAKPTPVMNNLTPSNEWAIPIKDLHFVEKIGDGNFSEVWLGNCYKTPVAIKKLMKGSSMSMSQFMEEAAIMKTLKNKNIVVLYGICTTKDTIYIITEYLKNGSLLDFLRREENEDLPDNIRVSFALQVANGMCYLERKRLIHRDLAARNVLVGESINCKIADFGLARILQEGEYNASSKVKFALKWTPPEAFLKNSFTIKSDVWSFGILCYEIFTGGEVPYPAFSVEDYITQVRDGYRMKQPSDCPDFMYEIMLSCWNKTAHQRPTFEFLHQQLQNFFVYQETSYYIPQIE
ncbi:tyrosine-protein kinase STK-like [Palaemon carinicauda]|uniref:tyrosine-protein kinase STK-like n=1 Tax=Palaemon carinicauda TaxID=392227 RepID=UPI0035B5D27A